MSKVSFRARTLDSNKPLPVYTEEELPDLAEYVANNRTVPQMPTGMEKEEESERHLQKVITARQNFNESGKSIVIPIPEASIPVRHFPSIYHPSTAVPLYYVRVPGLGPNEDVPDYDLDSEDEEWLSAQSKERPLSPTHFERMMDKLEKGSGNTVLSDHDAQLLLKDEEDLVIAVYDYWLAKRLRLGHSLIPTVRNERRDGTSSSNPYLAFRKRTEKMQTRKNRKNDEHAYAHMLKLKRDLTRTLTLLELVKDREIKKNDLGHCYADIFRKRYQLEDWSGSLISVLRPVTTPTAGSSGRQLSTTDGHWDGKGLSFKVDGFDDNSRLIHSGSKNKKKKKKLFSPIVVDNESPFTPLTPPTLDKTHKDNIKDMDERPELAEPDGPFTFKRKVHIRYHLPLNRLKHFLHENPIDDNDPDSHIPKRYCYSMASFNGRDPSYSRRRQGRGGRTIWDRIHKENNDVSVMINSVVSDKAEESNIETEPATPIPLQTADEEGQEVPQSKCPCFYSVSPAPGSTHFDFSYLPFIDPSTYYCPDLHKGYGQFGGLLSDTEIQDEASSFSTLPTSQFALKPSSFDNTSNSQVLQSNGSSFSKGTNDRVTSLPPNNNQISTESSVDQSETLANNTLSVPPTHLSLVEVGLPVQIHVGNLKHLPKRDCPTPSPAAGSCGVPPTLPIPPPPPPPPPPAQLSTTNQQHNNNDTGVHRQPLSSSIEDPLLHWQAFNPSSNVLTLDKPRETFRMSQRPRRNSCLTSQTASSVTSQFNSQAKSETVPVTSVSTTMSGTAANTVLSIPPFVNRTLPHSLPSPLSSNSLQPLPLQNNLVGGLATDPRNVDPLAVREKTAVPVHQNNQKNSSNGSVHDLFHHSKLQAEAEDIKHALAAGTVVNHAALVDGTTNSIVKLKTPSQVT